MFILSDLDDGRERWLLSVFRSCATAADCPEERRIETVSAPAAGPPAAAGGGDAGDDDAVGLRDSERRQYWKYRRKPRRRKSTTSAVSCIHRDQN